MKYKIDFESLSWETPIQGLRQRAIGQDGKLLRLIEFTREMEPHWCEKGHWGYILEGQMEISFDKEKHIYNAGDGVFIPPGQAHRHKGRILTNIVKAVFVEEI